MIITWSKAHYFIPFLTVRDGDVMTLGKYVVEWFANDKLQTKFFRYESEANKFCSDLYDECLVVGSVSRDDYGVYGDLASQGLL